MKHKELNFDLKQLRSFLEIIRENSFTRASRNLKIGQATISHHISQLEEMLGITLIERSSKSFSITPEGKAFKKFADRIFRDIDKLKDDLERASFGGTTQVTASTTPATYLLPPVIARLREENEERFYSVKTSDSREAIELVKEGKAEIGIVGKQIKHPSLTYEKIFSDEIVLIAAPDAPGKVDPEEIPSLPFITREGGSGSRDAYEKFLNRHHIIPSDLNIVYECSTPESLKEAVMAGIGISFISRLAIEKELALKTLQIVELEDEPIIRNFYAVCSSTKKLAPPAQGLLDALKGEI